MPKSSILVQWYAFWKGLWRSLVHVGIGVLGQAIPVREIDKTEIDVLGYTDNRKISLNPNHDIVLNLLEKKGVYSTGFFLKGVYAHELMHNCATDFTILNEIIERIRSKEGQSYAEIFANLFNMVEDPAIEYFAPAYFGGELLKALRFMIKWLWRVSPPIDPNASPYGQYCMALIHYGDLGKVKGKFASENARDIFIKTQPLIDSIIHADSGRKRVEMTIKLYEETKPLWLPVVKEKEAMQKLLKSLMENGMSIPKGNGTGTPAPYNPEEDEQTTASREKSVKRLIKERKSETPDSEEDSSKGGSQKEEEDPDSEKNKGGSSGCSEESEKDQKSESSSESDDEGSKDANGSGDTKEDETSGEETSEKTESANTEADKEENKNKESSAKNSSAGAGTSQEENQDKKNNPDGQDSSPSNRSAFNEKKSEDESNEAGEPFEEDEFYDVDEKDINDFTSGIEDCLREEQREKQEEKNDASMDIDNIPVVIPAFGNVKCVNRRLTPNASLVPEYEAYLEVNHANDIISPFVSQIERIFKRIEDEKNYRNSGRVAIKKLSSSRVSSRVFTRHVDPGNRRDTAVMLLVDESGSMGGNKTLIARQCAIFLAESFSRLEIPLYVIGFTTTYSRNEREKVHHLHYLPWSNTLAEKAALLGIAARNNNFDGYSIRYASALLQKRPEKNKLLIVISDGDPVSEYYNVPNIGVADTKRAIESCKHAVIGVLIGKQAADVVQYMYGQRFAQAEKPFELFSVLTKKFEQEVKRW